MTSERTSRLAHSTKLLALELVIVFAGVYGAFWVDNYRDLKEQEESATKMARALQQDLQDYVEVTGRFVEAIDAGFADWETERSRGETPPPYVFRIYGAELPPVATWDAVRQAEAAKLLDPGLLFDLGFFYNEITGMAHRYVRYATFTEAEVLSRLKPGGSRFYSEDGLHLLPQFAAHMDRLREYRNFLAETLDWSACLVQRLESPREPSVMCRNEAGITPM